MTRSSCPTQTPPTPVRIGRVPVVETTAAFTWPGDPDARRERPYRARPCDPRTPSQRLVWLRRIARRAGLPLPAPLADAGGVASQRGPLRPRNEDAAIGFRLPGLSAIILADGVGSLPDGQLASHLAVTAAGLWLVRWVGQGHRRYTRCVPLGAVAASALEAASQRLVNHATACGAETGLRTTAIIALADASQYGIAYIGDGCGHLRRASGHIERWLHSHRDPATGHLVRSLGPNRVGEPVSHTLPRRPGDLLLCGTDGVSDLVTDEGRFATDVQRAVSTCGGLRPAVAAVVTEIVCARDEWGWIAGDNVTLGIIGTPSEGAGIASQCWRRLASTFASH